MLTASGEAPAWAAISAPQVGCCCATTKARFQPWGWPCPQYFARSGKSHWPGRSTPCPRGAADSGSFPHRAAGRPPADRAVVLPFGSSCAVNAQAVHLFAGWSFEQRAFWRRGKRRRANARSFRWGLAVKAVPELAGPVRQAHDLHQQTERECKGGPEMIARQIEPGERAGSTNSNIIGP